MRGPMKGLTSVGNAAYHADNGFGAERGVFAPSAGTDTAHRELPPPNYILAHSSGRSSIT
jgi:hypothetical protein